MRFESIQPVAALRPYVAKLVISENAELQTYTVFPSTTLVAGFQYKGKLTLLSEGSTETLSTAGITGLTNAPKQFSSTAGTGTILIYFTETGLSFFTRLPIHELFNQSISLDCLFLPGQIAVVEEKLSGADTDKGRINIVERFLVDQLREIEQDRLVVEAVRLIHESKGILRISELHKKLHTSASPLEKRFRQRVGTTPKKFASIVRFNTALAALGNGKSLTEICYDSNFFDQAHFIKDFSQFSGQTPERFLREME